MVAPLAYQKGPLTPYSQATLELCKIVAAHVHLTNSPLKFYINTISGPSKCAVGRNVEIT